MDDRSKARSRASSTGRVTLDDIALRVGTSSITVSRAFRNPELVSEDLRTLIFKVSGELGYVRNRAASALASSKSMNIAVIVPSLGNSVFVDTINGVEKILRSSGYQMLLGVSNYSSDEEDALVRAYMAFDPDGIILTGVNYRDAVRRMVERAKIPVVHMMELSTVPGLYSVGFSQEAAAEAMTWHLLKQGYKRIAFVASQLDSRTLARNRGYRDTLINAGLYDSRRELLVPEPSSIGLGGVLLERMTEQAPDCDAIFFCNDDLAQGALFACQRLGISVPDQLAIAGFNDLPASAHIVPSLTTVATPRYDIGVKSAQMLVGLIAGQMPAKSSIDVGFELKPRQST
jgi:LacI family gluconate utilization system Gnt-I transcriptional repressor